MLNTFRTTWALLRAGQRKKFWLLSILVLGGMTLEVAGVGLVLPILAVITDPGWMERARGVPLLGAWMSDQTQRNLLVFGIAAMLAIGVMKFLVLSGLAYAQTRFVGSVERTLSTALFERYLRRSWEFHLQHNSAELIQLSRVEVTNVAYGVNGFLNLFTDGMMIIAVLALLVIVEPVAAIVGVSLLAFTGAVFHFAAHARLERWGRERQAADTDRIRYLQQGLASVREISILGCQHRFAGQYEERTRAYVRVLALQQFLQQMPRLGIELVAISSVAMICGALVVISGRQVEGLVPAVGLFVAASIRLAPSANRILGSIQLIRWGAPAIAAVSKELANASPAVYAESKDSRPLPPERGNLMLKGLRYRYPGATRDALHGVDLEIAYGSIVGLIGPSGSGKSTLMDVILGLVNPSAGHLALDGIDISGNIPRWQARIGYVPQDVQLIDDTLRRNVAFGMEDSEVNDDRVWAALREAKVEDFVRSLPQGIDTRVGEDGSWLSGGQRQRIGIARALYRQPHFIVLDEATSALDSATEAEVMTTIAGFRRDKTIIIVAHRLGTLAICDRVFRLEDGTVVQQGTYESVTGMTPRDS